MKRLKDFWIGFVTGFKEGGIVNALIRKRLREMDERDRLALKNK